MRAVPELPTQNWRNSMNDEQHVPICHLQRRQGEVDRSSNRHPGLGRMRPGTSKGEDERRPLDRHHYQVAKTPRGATLTMKDVTQTALT
jgi:hypothetical protein